MTDAQAPGLPNAAIDFNKMHDNAVAGKTGDAMLEGVVIEKPAPADPVKAATPAKAPSKSAPAKPAA